MTTQSPAPAAAAVTTTPTSATTTMALTACTTTVPPAPRRRRREECRARRQCRWWAGMRKKMKKVALIFANTNVKVLIFFPCYNRPLLSLTLYSYQLRSIIIALISWGRFAYKPFYFAGQPCLPSPRLYSMAIANRYDFNLNDDARIAYEWWRHYIYEWRQRKNIEWVEKMSEYHILITPALN